MPQSALQITNDSEFIGKSFICSCTFNQQPVVGKWSLLDGEQHAQMNQNGKVTIGSSTQGKSIIVQCQYQSFTASKTILVSYGDQLSIEGPTQFIGTSGNAVAVYNEEVVQPVWVITSGQQYVQIDSSGNMLFNASGKATITASYNGLACAKQIEIEYKAGTTQQTTVDEDGTVTTSEIAVVQNPDGSTTTTTSSRSVQEDGFTSTTESTLVESEDGSSVFDATTANQDGTTSRQHKETASDGSSESVTTSYDAGGDPKTAINENVDVSGNASTQNISYSNGQEIVTGYDIDTSGSEEGYKQFDADGVNTGFYCFDAVAGFMLDLHFTIDFTDQPTGQDSNLHNILTMKRADPEPWYGFQLRQSGSLKQVTLGAQFDTGNNVNTNLSPTAANWVVQNKIAEFDFQIKYDPALLSNTFVCKELISNRNIYSSNYLFPDIPELRYLAVCIGYAMNQNAQPYRYSKINVMNFQIEKLSHAPAVPSMTFAENTIAMTCDTSNAEIYYRIGDGQFAKYSEPIQIFADTTVTAYSILYGTTSQYVTQTFIYDDGIDEPIINCDGEYVEINCSTSGAEIYYRIGTDGQFIQYAQPFEISQTSTVQAYSTIDGNQSETVSEICEYVPIVLQSPTIQCNDNLVIIQCQTDRSSLHYRINQTGVFKTYEEPFSITQDTLVEAYSTYKTQTSQTVSKTCEYTPEHDYGRDYLTFKMLSDGTICWKAFGGLTKTIEYSINGGSWTSLTSTSNGATISVSNNSKVRFRGNNTTYATSKSIYSGFEGGTASFDIEGNIMSLLYGDGFESSTQLTNTTYQFCSIFKKALVVSAKNLVLPATAMTQYCYRAMFSWCTTLVAPPELPAATLAQGCYWYMFEQCAIMKAPVLNAATLVKECYGHMFEGCAGLNTIVCLATGGFNQQNALANWTLNVAGSGTFVKSSSATGWPVNSTNGIPAGWTAIDDVLLYAPTIQCDGETVILECDTEGAEIYYRTGQVGEFQQYQVPIPIIEDTVVETYSAYQGHVSQTITETCIYVQETPFERSNKTLSRWVYAGNVVDTPFSVNKIDGHSSNYAKGTFNFETTVSLKEAQTTYLWFQHADQSADIYVDDVKVGTHWGGYNAFFFDITNFVHRGTNRIRVALCNLTRNTLAPCAGDFNFNATLGNVKLFTSPCLPAMKYGYDGFHITSSVTSSSATVNVKTTVPAGAQLVCTITNKDGYEWSNTKTSNGEEQTFTTVIAGTNLHLWNGKINPYLYNVKLEIYKDGELYHRYERPYGLRYYEYVIDQEVNGQTYTGFLLNGQPYLLRGVCMHDDLAGKANALTDADYAQEFAIIQELGCNFIRLAHYPHPKEVYDWCDRLGIVVQTEVPCVNKLQSTLPEDYYTHLTTQYTDMVEQHFNHPCIVFWGLSNETTTDDKEFAKQKIEEYYSVIKSIDNERLIGLVMSHSYSNPSAYFNDPNIDWFGCNIYVGWYIDKVSNDPTSHINNRLNSTTKRVRKPIGFSEYGCGGTQHCHSDDFKSTTTTGNYDRHDIEYMMWLHEGHIAAIRNFPQLMFTAEWQLFDIAVSNRNEGYTECLDGVNTSINDDLRRLNNKGLVERDHTTKKDTFYLYKAEWNSEDKFVHICGKDYAKTVDRVLKCYTNDTGPLSLYEGSSQTALETVQVADHIAQFTARTFSTGVTYRVAGADASDSITFQAST